MKSTSEGAHLLDYIRVLLKRLWLIVGIFVLVLGAVGFATWRATPMYRATATIDIKQPSLVLGKLDPTSTIHAVNQSQKYLNTQYALLTQKSTIERMVDEHGLVGSAEFPNQTKNQIVRSILGNIEVRPRRETTLVDVSVIGTDKDVVWRVANYLVITFQNIQVRDADREVEKTLNELESRTLDYRQKVELIDLDIQDLLEQADTDRATFLDKFEAARQRARMLSDQLEALDLELAERELRYGIIKAAFEKMAAGGNGNGGADESALEELFDLPFITADRTIHALETSLIVMMSDLRVLEQGLGAGNPKVLAKKKEIDDQRALIRREKISLLRAEKMSYEERLRYRERMAERRNAREDEFREKSALKRDYDRLDTEKARWSLEADRYYSLYEKVMASRDTSFKPVEIIQSASAPYGPFSPDKRLNMLLAVLFGLLGGMAVAFFLEYMDDTVKTKEELQKVTDVPLFGVIPNISARKSDVAKKDLYAYSQPKSTISEAFRGIRTAISYSSQREENRVYLVTSAGPKEGKTTIAINVATVMAYSGTRTLLVDCDLRRPRVHKSFDLNNTKGLTNLIIGDSTVEDVVQSTDVENLFVIPSGPIPPNPSELLGRERMMEVLEDLRTHFDRILLDTPPIGAVTDAAVLGRIVDSVILVVHAGKTRKKLIERGLEQLNQIDVDVSGIVLNNLKIGRKRYYPGYYHYYYYYSSYYGSDDKARKSKKKS